MRLASRAAVNGLVCRLWVLAEDTRKAAGEAVDVDEAGELRNLAAEAQALGDWFDARLSADLAT
jgi:hypothetical protein